MTEAEFIDVYERYSGPVLRYCAFRLGIREDAEDAAAEVFARFIRNGDRVDPGKRERWLMVVARNVCTDHVRRAVRVREASAALEIPEPAAQAPVWVDPRVRAAVTELTVGQQEVVFLRAVEDRTFAEIGCLTGKPETAARMQYHRAVKRLRDRLSEVER